MRMNSELIGLDDHDFVKHVSQRKSYQLLYGFHNETHMISGTDKLEIPR